MTASLVVQLRKEVRALLPAWLGVAAATTIAAVVVDLKTRYPNYRHDEELWVALLYAVGVLAVAAMSMGQELTHGTLGALLVQPVGRLRILCTKLAVLIPAVVALGAMANILFLDRYLPVEALARPLIVWGPVAAAIGLVPVLTILTRKPLGGVVFAIAIPGMLTVALQIFTPLNKPTQVWPIAWYGVVLLSTVGAIALLRRFATMEAVSDTGAGLRAPVETTTTSHTTTRRNWIWLQVKNELRLQSLTFIVSALYLIVAVGILAAESLDPDYGGLTFYGASALHGGLIALLAGALSCAEERHLGTLASQVLLPKPAWRLWTIKTAVTVGLALALAIGLPTALSVMHPLTDRFWVNRELVIGIALFTVGAMYVSSLSSNGPWAFLAALPAVGLAYLGGGLVITMFLYLRNWFPRDYAPIRRLTETLRQSDPDAYRALNAEIRWIIKINDAVPIVLLAGAAVLVLYFTARNVRSLDRNVRTVANQVAALFLYAWAAALIWFAVYRLSWASVG